MKEDYFTNTPEDAGRYEEMRAETDAAADRPTLAELQRDEVGDCACSYYGAEPDCPIHNPWDES